VKTVTRIIIVLGIVAFVTPFAWPSRNIVILPPIGAVASGTMAVATLNATSVAAAQGTSDPAFVMSGNLPRTILPQMQAPFDATAYDAKLLALANLPAPRVVWTGTSTARTSSTIPSPLAKLWPVKAAYPNAGAILPFNRIVAYYGNFYSTQMGILGQYSPDVVLSQLASTTAMWAAVDPSTPAIPAIQYIAVTAQGSPGADGKYRLRMPPDQIEKAITMAQSVNGLVFLDVQVGLSNVQTEVPLLAPYLALPQVGLALDPEFSMKDGARPGTEIGTMNSDDINFAAQYLAQLVRDNNLPPKILVIHRFTEPMLKNYQAIEPLPEVQIVMDMDGFGSSAKKINTYLSFIQPEPVQFAGIKLFYKNDVSADHVMTPAEVLKLTPQPSYIQYQ
jgi:hypothetical protein